MCEDFKAQAQPVDGNVWNLHGWLRIVLKMSVAAFSEKAAVSAVGLAVVVLIAV